MRALPHTPLTRRLDAWTRRAGDWASWLWLVLLAVVVLNVILRYAFGEGRIEFEEIQWHLYATGFLFSLGYAFESDDHIRVDFLRERFSPRLQAWIELYGTLLLLLPFVFLVLWFGVPFVLSSWHQGEVSAAPAGLPYRWAVKSMLLWGFALLALAAVSRALRVVAYLFAGEDGEEENEQEGERGER